jgi:hypothetical protein
MKKEMIVLFIAMLTGFSAYAQNFPASEKEIKEILCAGPWKGDTISHPGRMIAMANAGVTMEIVFNIDGTYYGKRTGMLADETAGKWVVDVAKKQVLLYKGGKGKEPKNVVLTLAKDRMTLVNPEKPDMIIIFGRKDE